MSAEILNENFITFVRCFCSEACAGKDTCDRTITTKIHHIRNWVMKIIIYSRDIHFMQSLSETRLKNSFAFMHEPCDQCHMLLKVRKTQQAKIMGITSDSEYDYDNNGTPLCLRV